MSIKIDKRVPFGFKGIWGKCYKLTNYNETKEVITYQRSKYYDVGYDVQFKYLEDGVDKSISNSQAVANLVASGEYRVVKTTDATFNKGKYECICQLGDIVKIQDEYWVIDKIDERSVYNPARQTFYYLSIRKIFDIILTGEN